MFVPTLRVKSLAYKTPQKIATVNSVHLKRFTFETRTSTEYCTPAVNEQPCDKKNPLADKYCEKSKVQQTVGTNGEILLIPNYADLKNNCTSDGINYINDSNKDQVFRPDSGSSTIITSNVDDPNKSNISTPLNDEITKQTNTEVRGLQSSDNCKFSMDGTTKNNHPDFIAAKIIFIRSHMMDDDDV
jgi:hypothetical protein